MLKTKPELNGTTCSHLPTFQVCLVGSPTFPFLSIPRTENTCLPWVRFLPFQTPFNPLPQLLKAAPSSEHSKRASSVEVQESRGDAFVSSGSRGKAITGELLSTMTGKALNEVKRRFRTFNVPTKYASFLLYPFWLLDVNCIKFQLGQAGFEHKEGLYLEIFGLKLSSTHKQQQTSTK